MIIREKNFMEIKFIDVSKNNILFKDKIIKNINNIIDSGNYILGENLKLFEERFAKYCGAKYAIGVNSGTDALRLSLMALNITEGEIITVSSTFAATIMSILSVGAIPKFVDIDLKNGLMDVNDLKKKINKRTKAIIPVHFMGHPCNMNEINKIAIKYNIPVIEDACQSIGATILNKKVGTFGVTGCFSFFPTKNLSCMGDGGAIITNDINIYNKICLLRNFGRQDREDFVSFGLNSRLDEIQASILNIKLDYLDKWNNKRNERAKYYTQNLPKGIEHISPIKNTKSSYHLYAIKVNNNINIIKKMNKYNIDCRTHYSIPVHRQPFIKKYYNKLDNTDILSSQTLSLPINEFITQKEQDYILSCLKRVINE